jgi:hypothetical protein
MVTTSDDKSLRVWEWDIPVDIKYIADPSMHSMPSVALNNDGVFNMVLSGFAPASSLCLHWSRFASLKALPFISLFQASG